MITVFTILGPTACGKSAAAMHIAQRVGCEIVSVDSRQIYRRIDIGTAKPTPEELIAVPHHLIDILDLHDKSSAADFSARAHEAIHAIAARGRLPLIVGGSGLYFRAISEGLFDIHLSAAARVSFAQSISGVSVEKLRRRLIAADPESARRIHPNDRYRIARALEVSELSGMPLSEHLRRSRASARKPGVQFIKVGLELPRRELHRRIDERTERMLDRGWVAEVRSLLENGADPNWPGLRTLGYPEIIAHVRSGAPLVDTTRRINELTHQYAKRQITWFKKEHDVVWFRADETQTNDRLVRMALGARTENGD